ncbi:MAG: DUF4097 family beta strand repeat protein [Clostridia bacterium]|nr:DUF4097 family beta strand repeat protein [Clostridia bacterium]
MMKRRIVICALCVCMLMSLCMLTSCNKGVVTSIYANADQYQIGAFEYNREDVKSITVVWYCGNIEVQTSEEEILSVSESGTGLPLNEQMHYWLKEDGTLIIRFWESGLRANVDENDKELTLQVPKEIDVSIITTTADVCLHQLSTSHLIVNTHSGDVEADSVVATGLDVTTTNGNVNIASLTTVENAVIATTSGDIAVDTLSVKNVSVSSTSGEIELGETVVQEKMKLFAVSGDMSVSSFSGTNTELKTVSGQIDAFFSSFSSANVESVSGNVYIKLPEEKGSTVYFETTSGIMEASSEYVHTLNNGCRFGSGEGVIRVETVSATLHIDW